MMNDENAFRLLPGAFNANVDSQNLRQEWEEWHRAFELTLHTRKIYSQSEKLVAMLTIGGRGLQRIFYNLLPVPEEIYPELVEVPLRPHDVPEYDNAVKRLETFFVGKQNLRVELEVFRSIRQKNEESFKNFLLRLRAQASRCDFGVREETEILQQVTVGARDEKIKDKGLENVMNLNEITNYAQNRETLLKQKEKSKQFREEQQVNYVPAARSSYKRESYQKPGARSGRYPNRPYQRQAGDRSSNQRGPRWNEADRNPSGHGRTVPKCNRCGSWSHDPDSSGCFARQARCNKCGTVGHYARVCTVPYGGHPGNSRGHGGPEANMLAQSALEWKEELPRRPKPEDIAKV
uniref:(northern house mosquito) hypothetical protein n=1 Tax=Culex pipiens TaxID=7175 RepID=A0A8D8A521_CULPI